MWVELFNKFFEETVKIEKNQPLGFFAIEPENFNFKYETKNKKKRTIQNKKSLSKKKNKKKKRDHLVVFLTDTTLPMLAET